MKYWLISDEDVAWIRGKLNHISFKGYDGIDELVTNIKNTLDTGLHTTDCVPSDFKENTTASYIPSGDENKMLIINQGSSIDRFIWNSISKRWEPFGKKWMFSGSDKDCPDCKKQNNFYKKKLKSLTELEYRKLYEGDFSLVDEEDDKNICTCHERDSSQVCDYCYSQGYRGHMQE